MAVPVVDSKERLCFIMKLEVDKLIFVREEQYSFKSKRIGNLVGPSYIEETMRSVITQWSNILFKTKQNLS